MPATAALRKKVTLLSLLAMKERGERIAALGVYDAPTAAIADRLGFEILMIGNSGPMSLVGYRDASRVPRDDILYMTQAVSRMAPWALKVATMPYMSFQISAEEAVRTAAWLVSDGGAECVQCHGDVHSAPQVGAIVKAGIPVLAHIGLRSMRKTEQSGYRVQGRTAPEAFALLEDAKALAAAGVFSFVVELVPVEVTGFLRRHLEVPIISLGSGDDADGVYQVSADITGFSTLPPPKSATSFVDAKTPLLSALKAFIKDVDAHAYPPATAERRMKAGEYDRLLRALSPAGR